ncbi:MAG: response regulator [Lachnospiraceae bacterium]|nr:response regulator [Lachnospiraceae bacterium]
MSSINRDTIVFTNENCIGCNKCIKVCSAMGACISSETEDGNSRIVVDGDRCVACGSCIDVCAHKAREFNDDTERFIRDLKAGEKISLLIAPAFKANYPDKYESVLGGLKALGINRIISVSFGADITTWGYLNYIKKYNFVGGISQPCPALVGYIERYIPELIPKIFPVQSPLMCAAIYARKQMGITDKFAFISPCIAKKLEIDDPHNKGLVQYNLTFDHLMKYVEEHGISGELATDEVEYGLGSFYPAPGGLTETVKWFLGDGVYIRQIEGEKHLYEWLHKNTENILEEKTPFLLIDALNCRNGCLCGTAVDHEKAKTDEALYEILKIREQSKRETSGNPWSKYDSLEERFANYNLAFADLNLEDYLRGYTDKSEGCKFSMPSEEEFDRIFNDMNKTTEESRHIDCTCCGYNSCKEMAAAIYNGINQKENCIHYEKDMVQKLATAKAVAEEANAAKSHFLASMSHEIRTPINAVLGLDTMILRDSEDDNIRKYALNIRSAGQTLLSLINDILDLSKIESGKLEIVPVEYDISSLFNDIINMITPKADDKGLEFKIDIDENIPGRLRGDDVRLRQILLNLLSNAVKYTHKGSVTFKAKCNIEADDAIIKFEVIDTGIGISEENMENLFDEYVRIEEGRNRNIEGTGLGLNIAMSLLNLMGSELKVDSVYGEGSTFHFEICQPIINAEPIGNINERLQERASEFDYDVSFTIPDAKLLVVDDNAMNRLVFCELLRDLECEIDEAESGKKCLEMVKDKKYDIIFMDHMMPEMDGVETFEHMKEFGDYINADTPVVVLTANAINGAREMFMEYGFNDFLTKPVVPEKLEKLLGDYIDNSRKKPGKPGGRRRGSSKGAEKEKRFKPIEGIDWDYPVAFYGGEDRVAEMVKIFIINAERELEGLVALYNRLPKTGSFAPNSLAARDVISKAGNLQVFSAGVGALHVSSLAEMIVIWTEDGNADALQALMKIFPKEWRKQIALLADEYGDSTIHDAQA